MSITLLSSRLRIAGRAVFLALLLLMSFGVRTATAKYEQEQLDLENNLQQRIESILAKMLPSNSYLVTIKVEMDQNAKPTEVRSKTGGRRGSNPFLAQNQFVLPGVPQKKEFVQQPDEAPTETVVNSFSAETMVRRILITILTAPTVTQDQIRAIRDVISSSIPFNPLRGDEMDIHSSPLLGKTASSPTGAGAAPGPLEPAGAAHATGFLGMGDRATMALVIVLTAVVVVLLILVAFLFGPVRAFLNRLLAVLPRVGEQAAYAVSNAPGKPGAGAGPMGGPISVDGNIRTVRNGNGDNGDAPFHFIREDQLNKLPILFRQMGAPQAALVLAYLPPEWASQVLSGLEGTAQTAVMSELSQAKEVPPEIVKEVEAQVKAKLPYLVGGVDWIQSVYQLTQPQTQRALLGTLNQQSPELAQALRRRTFFFEDIGLLAPGALRLLVQDLGYPVAAMAIKDEKPEVRDDILRKLPVATREIIQQELELSSDDKVAIGDAKLRLVNLARRLVSEGRITLPERK